jgi:hypothetical protein
MSTDAAPPRISLIDPISASLGGRQRLHVAGHVRTNEQQILDALLRIEELLIGRFQPSAVAPVAPKAEPTKKGGFIRGKNSREL